jgi:hypothetical protein
MAYRTTKYLGNFSPDEAVWKGKFLTLGKYGGRQVQGEYVPVCYDIYYTEQKHKDFFDSMECCTRQLSGRTKNEKLEEWIEELKLAEDEYAEQ